MIAPGHALVPKRTLIPDNGECGRWIGPLDRIVECARVVTVRALEATPFGFDGEE